MEEELSINTPKTGLCIFNKGLLNGGLIHKRNNEKRLRSERKKEHFSISWS